MTRIEKAVKIVSDLYEFYRKIPKIPDPGPRTEESQTDVSEDSLPRRDDELERGSD
jgi:hypothetical protein